MITGLSGSGKSSLAFDTIYAEGQRRYVESLRPMPVSFSNRWASPSSIRSKGFRPPFPSSKSASHNPPSTVGTVTEIYDYLRLLFAPVRRPSSISVARKSRRRLCSRSSMPFACFRRGAGSRYWPRHPRQEGRVSEEFLDMRRAEYVRARVDGQLVESGQDITVDRRNTGLKSWLIGWS